MKISKPNASLVRKILGASGSLCVALTLNTTPAAAQVADPKVEQLARNVIRAQSIRDVKQLQIAYQQYAQFGLWNQMADLFSDQGEAIFGDKVIHGRAAIAKYLASAYGGGKQGLPTGGIHNQILLAPVVTLSYDGASAQGRWSEVTMLGRYGGKASWEGGMEENDYIREGSVWKFARLHYYPQFAGPYETGWFSLTPTSPIVPYHYSPSQAGRPVPDEPGDADRSPTGLSLAQVEHRIQAMNDEDKVRNLQNVYGYYIDRKMWSDVTDLFSPDGALEIAGVGIYQGPAHVRRALERDGPEGLKRAEVNDHLQLDVVVQVSPNGQEARARGMELGMLTPKLGEAYWSVSTFENTYVKLGGIWHIRNMRIFPHMKSDYYQGWGISRITDPAPASEFTPDKPTPAQDAGGLDAIPDFFFNHPVTGKPITYPGGAVIEAVDDIQPKFVPSANPAPAGGSLTPIRLADDERKLAVSKAYDAVENVSSSFGYYMDDFLWDEWVENMSAEGRRIQGAGWYIGHDHMYRAMTQAHIGPPSMTNTRDGIRIHMRTQPVIDVAPDARSAKIRTRMWLYYANTKQAGAWNSGMYPSDAAVLENGVWKMDVDEIDETYFSSSSYKDGWAKPRARTARQEGDDEGGPPARGPQPGGPAGGARGESRNGNPIDFPPDVPTSALNDFRYKDFRTTNYPDIKPMWFSYTNPVSGRVPPHLCPDIKTCTK